MGLIAEIGRNRGVDVPKKLIKSRGKCVLELRSVQHTPGGWTDENDSHREDTSAILGFTR